MANARANSVVGWLQARLIAERPALRLGWLVLIHLVGFLAVAMVEGNLFRLPRPLNLSGYLLAYLLLAMLAIPLNKRQWIGLQPIVLLVGFWGNGVWLALSLVYVGALIITAWRLNHPPAFRLNAASIKQYLALTAWEVLFVLGLMLAQRFVAPALTSLIAPPIALIGLICLIIIWYQLLVALTLLSQMPNMPYPARLASFGRYFLPVVLPLSAVGALALYSETLATFAFTAVLLIDVLVCAVILRALYDNAYTLRLHGAELRMLQTVGQNVGMSIIPRELGQTIFHHLQQILSVEHFLFALTPPEQSSRAHSIVYLFETDRITEYSGVSDRLLNRLVDHVIHTRQAVIWRGSVRSELARTSKKAPYQEADQDDFVSFIGLPLLVQDQCLGMMAILHPTSSLHLGVTNVSLLSTLAAQLGAMIRSANLYDRIFTIADRLALLNNVALVVSASLDLETVLESIGTITSEVGAADQLAIFLVDPDNGEVALAYGQKLGENFAQHLFHADGPGQAGLKELLAQWGAMAIETISTDPRAAAWRGLAQAELLHSMFTVPLIAADKIIGVMASFYSQPRQFDPTEIDLLTTLANEVSISIMNAQYHRETETRARELTSLVETSRSFTITLDFDGVTERVLDALYAMINPSFTALALVNSETPLGYVLNVTGQRGMPTNSQFITPPSLSAVVATGKSARIRFYQVEAPEDTMLMKRLQVKALYAFPLLQQDRVFALILIGFDEDRTLPERHGQLIQAMLNQAATALLNAQSFNQVDAALQKRVDELQAIEDLSRKISGSFDLDAIIAETLSSAIKVTNADSAGLAYTLSNIPDSLQLVELFALDEQLSPLKSVTSKATGAIGAVLSSGETIYISDVRTTPAYAVSVLQGILSKLCIPIIHNGDRLGALILEARRLNAFTESDIIFARTLADHVAVAVYNAQLFAALQQQLNKLVNLRDLSFGLLAVTSLDETLKLVVEHTVRITSVRDVKLYLYDPAKEHLTLGASTWFNGKLPATKSLAAGHGIPPEIWNVAKTGAPRLSSTGAANDDASEMQDEGVSVSAGATAYLPMLRSGKTIGVLAITLRESQQFDDATIHLLELIASQAATAVENATLFDAVKTGLERLNLIIESARDGMILFDAAGRLAQVNTAAERLLNTPLKPLVGQHGLRLMAQFRQRLIANSILAGLTNEVGQWVADSHGLIRKLHDEPRNSTRRIFRLPLGDGSQDLEEVTMPAFDNAGNLAGRLVVWRDISEDLAQQRFREEISNMLVHDLRAPTGSIQTSLQLIKELIDTGDYEELKQVSVIAYENSEKLISLINSLMEIAKLEQSASMETDAKPLAPIADQAIETLLAYAQTANIRMQNLVPPDLPLVEMDDVAIRRVFINLIDNALRHTPNGGEVRIGAAATHVRGQAFVQINVTDTGKGIPDTFREQIFEKFSQVPRSAIRGHKGTGLGLTYCKRAIEAQGGRIWVEKGPEGGAMFNFTLPVAAIESSPSRGH